MGVLVGLTRLFGFVDHPMVLADANLVLVTALRGRHKVANEDEIPRWCLFRVDVHFEDFPWWRAQGRHNIDRSLQARLREGDGGLAAHVDATIDALCEKSKRCELAWLHATAGGVAMLACKPRRTAGMNFWQKDVVS